MSKVSLTASLDKKLYAEAQRLVEAGEFDNLSALVAEAIHTLVQRYEAVEQRIEDSMAGRVFQGMMTELDEDQRAQFDEFVTAYVGVAQPLLSDDDMVSLLSIFKAHGFKRTLTTLHDIEASKVPLTPHYLETILGENTPQASNGATQQKAIDTVANESAAPQRISLGTDNPTLATVAQLYETEIGGLTEKIGEQLKSLVADYPDIERWHDAFEAAATMNKRNLRYVTACLKGTGQKKFEAQKGKVKRGTSQSERVRSDKRKQIRNYEDYWEQKRKERQKDHSRSST